ncbi:MAG: hypothetical protein ABFD62_07090 [Syntrophaceae bacterium]
MDPANFPQPGDSHCQVRSLERIPLPFRVLDRFGYVLKRARRFLKRRGNFLLNNLRRRTAPLSSAEVIPISPPETLQPGDIVMIKSRQEILKTLDGWNRSRGCAFMEEMWGYCGSVQKVRKCVRKFLDERDYKVKKCRGIVILEGITCDGTKDFGACDRSCFFFWREEWLEKVRQAGTGAEQVKETSVPQKNVQSPRPE